jgi:hypothetical protein
MIELSDPERFDSLRYKTPERFQSLMYLTPGDDIAAVRKAELCWSLNDKATALDLLEGLQHPLARALKATIHYDANEIDIAEHLSIISPEEKRDLSPLGIEGLCKLYEVRGKIMYSRQEYFEAYKLMLASVQEAERLGLEGRLEVLQANLAVIGARLSQAVVQPLQGSTNPQTNEYLMLVTWREKMREGKFLEAQTAPLEYKTLALAASDYHNGYYSHVVLPEYPVGESALYTGVLAYATNYKLSKAYVRHELALSSLRYYDQLVEDAMHLCPLGFVLASGHYPELLRFYLKMRIVQNKQHSKGVYVSGHKLAWLPKNYREMLCSRDRNVPYKPISRQDKYDAKKHLTGAGIPAHSLITDLGLSQAYGYLGKHLDSHIWSRRAVEILKDI